MKKLSRTCRAEFQYCVFVFSKGVCGSMLQDTVQQRRNHGDTKEQGHPSWVEWAHRRFRRGHVGVTVCNWGGRSGVHVHRRVTRRHGRGIRLRNDLWEDKSTPTALFCQASCSQRLARFIFTLKGKQLTFT